MIDLLDETWAASSALVHARVDDAVWEGATGCPGWTVRDLVSHLVWGARLQLGLVAEEADTEGLDHVSGAVAQYMEGPVAVRRGVPGAQVLSEFDDVRSKAVRLLRSMDDDALAAPFDGPLGMSMPRDRQLPTAVFDAWFHEDDLRNALGVERDLASAPADFAIHRMLGAFRGLSVRVRLMLTDPDRHVVVGAGNAEPTATIKMSTGDFVTRFGGRDRPYSDAVVDGDTEAVAAALAILPATP